MRFRTSSSRPRPTALTSQRKLSWLIFLLGLVVILIWKASDPKTWEWINPEKPRAAERGQQERPRPILDDEPLPEGAFRSLPGDQNSAEDLESEEDGDPLTVAPELLESLDDRALGIRGHERDAYYAVLAKTRHAPLRVQEAAAHKVTYAELYNDLSRYRGRLVTLEGEVRRVVKLDDPHSTPEIGPTYEAWLFLRSAGPKYPICVRFVDLPPGMPIGHKIVEKVRVTGFVFKQYNYTTEIGIGMAPMIIARKPRWSPRQPPRPGHESAAVAIFSTVVLLALGFGFVAWRASVSTRPPRHLPGNEPTPESFADIEVNEPLDLNQIVARMEAEAEHSPGERDS